jgi:spore coat protein U-like protein
MGIGTTVKRALAALLSAGIGVVGLTRTADAGTSTGTLNLTVNVQATCTVAAPDILFGTYVSGQSTAVTGTSTVTVTCGSTGLSVALTADNGTHASGLQRRLANAANTSFINYDLMAAPSGVFGVGANSRTVIIGATGTATLAVNASIPGGQAPPSATTHTDAVVITATY